MRFCYFLLFFWMCEGVWDLFVFINRGFFFVGLVGYREEGNFLVVRGLGGRSFGLGREFWGCYLF